MTKRYYRVEAGAAAFTGAHNNVYITAGGVGTLNPIAFWLERIDIQWAAAKGNQLNDTIYMNYFLTDDTPDSSFDGSLVTHNLTDPDVNCHFTTLYSSVDISPGSTLTGPYLWSPAPGASVHSIDFAEFGGWKVDPGATADFRGCLRLSFQHDATHYGQSYRYSFIVSEDT